MLSFLLFIFGVVVLVKSSDIFTSFGEKLARSLGWSSFVTGMIILATGASLPELSTSLMASFEQNSSVALGIVLGSNLVHLLLILGLSLVLSKKDLDFKNFSSYGFLMASTAFAVLSLLDGTFSRIEALLGLSLYALFVFKTVSEKPLSLPDFIRPSFNKKDLAIFITAGLGVLFGAKLSLYSMSSLAEILKVPTAWVALLLFSVGIALPELIMFGTAKRKGQDQLALGVLVGSSIFNISIVMGLSGLVHSLKANLEMLSVSLFFLVFSTLLVLSAKFDRALSRWHGALLLLLYCLYVYQNFLLLL